ncbi:unnamed protein product [Symbiodinium natans]|uniref:Uncharacterized protein n=1 Tax=Symbiodinium natans TaxID=878477 RepID=A0A812J5X1_9DINO|nr:unnamed protein product [Symbiodinium natans]
MECWLENGHSLTFIPDPEHTPGAHQTTFNCFYAGAAAFFLCGLCILRERCRRDVASDDFYLLFFFLGATGHACAGAALQATAGDNWGTAVAKVLMVLSSGALLLDSCCALENAYHYQKKFLKRGFFGLCIGLLAGGLLTALLVWGSHFQVTMYFLAALALLCCVARATVWYVEPESVENFLRFDSAASMLAGALDAALFEPRCGYAGHPSCYAKCPWAPGMHFLIWVVCTILGGLGMTILQLCAPEHWAFPRLWRDQPTVRSGPFQPVPPPPW